MTPEIDVASYLKSAVPQLVENTNLWYGGVLAVDEPTVPALAVFVMPSGGAAPLALAGNGDEHENYATVQIYVRGDKMAYPATASLARDVYDALRYAPITGYLECRPLQTGPIYLGLDKDGHHALSINYELIYDG